VVPGIQGIGSPLAIPCGQFTTKIDSHARISLTDNYDSPTFMVTYPTSLSLLSR
jgi:hypothetical protein